MIRARARRTVLTSEPTDQSARTVTSRVATYIVAHRVASSVARSRSRRHPIHRIERISSGAGRGRHASIIDDRSIAERSYLGDAGGALERGTVLGDGRLGGDDAVRGRGRGGVHDGVCVCGSDRRSIDGSIVGVGAGVVGSQDWSCV